jgi:hypothetical protein
VRKWKDAIWGWVAILGIACLITAAFLAWGLPAALGILGGTLVLIALA